MTNATAMMPTPASVHLTHPPMVRVTVAKSPWRRGVVQLALSIRKEDTMATPAPTMKKLSGTGRSVRPPT